MAVRPARLADILRIIEVAREGHAKSVYARLGDIDRDCARTLFARAIHGHGRTNDGASFFLVSHKGDDIQGYFWGYLDRVYQIGDKLAATDVHFYLTPRANPRDALTMLTQFIRWADGIEDCIEIMVGKTDIIAADDGRYEALLKRKGFTTFGKIYRRAIEGQKQRIAA